MRPREVYVCSLWHEARDNRECKLAIAADTMEDIHVDFIACSKCYSEAYKRYQDLEEPFGNTAVLNAVLAQINPDSASREFDA